MREKERERWGRCRTNPLVVGYFHRRFVIGGSWYICFVVRIIGADRDILLSRSSSLQLKGRERGGGVSLPSSSVPFSYYLGKRALASWEMFLRGIFFSSFFLSVFLSFLSNPFRNFKFANSKGTRGEF